MVTFNRSEWYRIKERLKTQFMGLTDDDLFYEEGMENELIDRIQEKTGRPRHEIEELFKF